MYKVLGSRESLEFFRNCRKASKVRMRREERVQGGRLRFEKVGKGQTLQGFMDHVEDFG